MIPVRIEVEGFLCYRDKREINFDGHDLWVMSGRNGSGKSAIFDAMTYALFKAHRGGERDATNLIHADADGFTVTFEFDLGSERFRIRRSLRRAGNKSERQLFRRDINATSETERWPAVPETGGDKGLAAWVAANIGLTFETFTSSVLLMQGKAERLISAKPSDRHEILAGIVDLAKYDAISKRADQRRTSSKARSEALHSQLRSEPEIEPAVIERAEDIASEAERAKTTAEAEWRRSVKVEEQAATWRDLVIKRDAAIARKDHAAKVIDDSEVIGRDWNRLQDLDRIIPVLRGAVARRSRIEAAQRKSATHAQELARTDHDVAAQAALISENQKHLAAIVSEIIEDETCKSRLTERGLAIAEAVQRSRTARGHCESIEKLDVQIRAYSSDLEATAERLASEAKIQAAWKAASMPLKNLVRDREALREDRKAAIEATRRRDEARDGLAKWEGRCADRHVELKTSEATEREASERFAGAKIRAEAARAGLAEFECLSGLSNCDRCGQPLTPEHYASEEDRLRKALDLASQALEAARDELKSQEKALTIAKDSHASVVKGLNVTREAHDRAENDLNQAEIALRTHTSQCRDHYDALDESFRIQVAPEPPDDWLATTFPTIQDLDEAERHMAAMSVTQFQWDKANDRLHEKRELEVRHRQEAEALTRVVLEPGDETAEARRDALAIEFREIEATLKEHRTRKLQAENNRDQLVSQIEALKKRRTEADKNLAIELAGINNDREESARIVANTPPAWKAGLEDATEERAESLNHEAMFLRNKGTEKLAAELPGAQMELHRAEAEVIELDHKIDTITIDDRLGREEATARTQAAHHRLDQAEKARRESASGLDELRGRRDRRAAILEEAKAAEASRAVAETLAELLGRFGLQRDLLREAERGILDRANPILGEVSGGELQLRLVEGEDEPALQIEAVVRTHGTTQIHDLPYLSGSQKFRVAVSLALAIGQYARGKKERPIQSVIIDEGFGSLDRQGRDEMIAQLNNLKGQVARIILVSHQEDFASYFNDGYKFEIIDGATTVEPFHR